MPPYRYEPTSNPFAATIGEMLAHKGDIEAARSMQIAAIQARAAEQVAQSTARAQEQGAQAWSGAVQNIGQQAAGIPAAMEKQQLQQTQLQGAQQENAMRQMQMDAAKRLSDTKMTVSKLIQDPSLIGEDGTINPKALLEKSTQIPPGQTGPQQPLDATGVYALLDPINEALGKAHASASTAAQHRNDAIARLAKEVLRQGEIDPSSVVANTALGAAALVKGGIATQQQVDDILGPVTAHPDSARAVLQHLVTLGTPTKPIVLKPGEQGFDESTNAPIPGMGVPEKPERPVEVNPGNQLVTPEGKVVYTAPPKALDPQESALKEAQLKEINAKLSGTMPMSPKDRAELEIQRQRLSEEGAAPALTPDAIKLTAKQFAMTGQLPPMGMGKTGAKLRTDIINAAADEYKNLDLPSQVAAFKANQQSLKTLQGTADKVTAFESTAGKNLDQFLSLADKIPDTGVPWVNTPVRLLNQQLVGSANMAAANAARDVALREIARVTSDPNLTGSLTDAARKEVQSLSPENATFAQIKAVAKVLKQDMANVHSSLNDQIGAIQQRIATPPAGTSAPSAGAVRRFNPATGKLE